METTAPKPLPTDEGTLAAMREGEIHTPGRPGDWRAMRLLARMDPDD